MNEDRNERAQEEGMEDARNSNNGRVFLKELVLVPKSMFPRAITI